MDQLDPVTIVANRSFTNPSHTRTDGNSLQFMLDQTLLALACKNIEESVIICRPDPETWSYRQITTQPARLLANKTRTVVGFCGQRRAEVDAATANALDQVLTRELPRYTELLSYTTMASVCGNYYNLVVFASEEAKEMWSGCPAHTEAAFRFAPSYYQSIRLYSGALHWQRPGAGVIQLQRVRYIDYMEPKPWYAVRTLTPFASKSGSKPSSTTGQCPVPGQPMLYAAGGLFRG